MQLDERLKKIRKSKNLTQEQIANILDTTKQQYYLYEKGKRQLKAEQIQIICKTLNISADYLLCLIDKERPLY